MSNEDDSTSMQALLDAFKETLNAFCFSWRVFADAWQRASEGTPTKDHCPTDVSE
jgi:hypothetical protein